MKFPICRKIEESFSDCMLFTWIFVAYFVSGSMFESMDNWLVSNEYLLVLCY